MRIFSSKKAEEVCTDLVIKNNLKEDYFGYFLYVISIIRTAPYISKEYDVGDFIPLHSKKTEVILGSNHNKKVFDLLLKNKIIKTDNRYVVGEKSKGYKIAVDILDDNWYMYKSDLGAVSRRLELQHKKSTEAESKGHKTAIKWLKEVKIHRRNAFKYINHMSIEENKKEIYKERVKSIDEGVFFKVVDDTAGRLHTNLTNLPTSLRKHLTLNGEKLHQVDITNSQPMFLGLYLLGDESVDKDELKKYLKLCKSGKFYEFLAKNLKNPLNLKCTVERSQFKKQVFSGIFFDKNRKVESNQVKVFSESFPTIYKKIREIKIKNHNRLAIMLQKEEAKIIFRTLEVINCKYGDIPMTTIHDCIVTTEENLKKVKETLSEIFNHEYRFIPKLKCCKL